MRGAGSKNAWALFLLILAGIVLGGFIGVLAEGVPALSWLFLWTDFRGRDTDCFEPRTCRYYVWPYD